jgi:Na+/H+-dicarboxylate symporter
MSKKKSKLSLTAKIMLGILLGGFTGLILKYLLNGYNLSLVNNLFMIVNIGSDLFMNALRMLVIPVIFVSIVHGTLSLTDVIVLGRVAAKTLSIYLITTVIAVTIGIIASIIVGPGRGANLESASLYKMPESKPITEIISSIIPTNPIEAMANGDSIQIIIFAIFLGIAIGLAGRKAKPVVDLFESLNAIVAKLVDCIMLLAPYGIFCLMANIFKTIQISAISNLLVYFLVVLGVLLFQMLITYSILLRLFTKAHPILFFKKMKEMLIFSFTTSSSNATIPVTMDTVTNRCGVSNKVAAFTIPLGSTINMDGTAIMQGIATVFISQAYNIPLTIQDYLLIVSLATVASIGTAGIPSVGIVMLAMVLQKVGLPVEGIALILSVDRLLDMIRTSVNVTGDCMTACIVAHSEGELDYEIFNNLQAGDNTKDIDLHHMHNEQQ